LTLWFSPSKLALVATAYPQNDDKPLFPRGLSLNARAILLCLLSVILLGVDQRTDQLQPIRRVLSTATYPLDILAALPSTSWRWMTGSLTSRNNLQNENRELRRQLLLQNARLQRMDALDEENRRLRELMKSSTRLQSEVLVAEIIAVDMDPYRHAITLNKGLAHKVYDGQPLLDAYGVLGQVDTAAAMSSTAVLITDANHAIPVTNNRSGVRTVAYGTGQSNRLSLPHVPNHSDMDEGDLLVTSGLGGRFPAGYPVAMITSIQRDYGQPFASIHAKPTAHVTESRHVLLAWHEHLDELSSDEPTDETTSEAAADKPALGRP
jgi:rod shape-determining protein MreC